MSRRKKIDYVVLTSKLYYLCDKYGLEPSTALTLMQAERNIYCEEEDSKKKAMLKWAIAVTNDEEWAMELAV